MALEIIITACQGVFIVSLLVIGLFAKKYLPSYLQQKGLNLATKEDIKEITEKIESVKTQYMKVIVELSAEISIRNEQKLRVLEKRNEALLKLFEACQELITRKFSIDLPYFLLKQSQIAPNNQTFTENFLIKIVSHFRNYQLSTERLFLKVMSSGTRVFLFYPSNNPNDVVITSSIKLMELIFSFQQNFSKEFTSLMNSLNEIILSHLTNKSSLPIDISKINALIVVYLNNIKPNIDAMSKAIGQYIAALNTYFNKLGYKQLSDQFSQK